MANARLGPRIGYPSPSAFSGDAFRYLYRVADALNELPVFSYTSYDGGPNSNLTGAPGDLCVNVVSSGQTARLYVKELGSSNTGWVSFTTM